MLNRTIQIPSLLSVGKGLLGQFDTLLQRNFVYIGSRILLTEEPLYRRYETELTALGCHSVYFVEAASVAEAERLETLFRGTGSLMMGFGGGKVLDVVKLVADRENRPYISIPSTLSHDGIYSPVARLTDENGRKRSFGVKAPLGIIVDLDVIAEAPKVTIMAGVGDLISNLSALKDWQLAQEKVNESANDFAHTLALTSADGILSSTETDVLDPVFLQRLAHGLIMSGLAMGMAGSSRPCSGAEHMISHAIDELYPERSTLHGLQVAWAHLLVERFFRKNAAEADRIEALFERLGIMTEIQNRVTFTEEEMARIISLSPQVRNRYTILNECPELIQDWSSRLR
jgi:glycerol-1-phosphate dehydrogenase [NAD(P)+]